MFEQIIASDAGSRKLWYLIYGRHIFTNVILPKLTCAARLVVLLADFSTPRPPGTKKNFFQKYSSALLDFDKLEEHHNYPLVAL